MYLTYVEYQNMGGALDEATFNDLEFEASCKIDWWTFNRLKGEAEYPEALKRCMYKIILLIQQQMQASALDGGGSGEGSTTSTAGISSMSNDGVSISYNVISASQAVELASKQIGECISQYLSDVRNSLGRKVLYRGLYPGE